jgi:hypothetical protein
MKAAVFKVRTRHKLRLSKIDPDETANLDKNEAIPYLAALHERISVLQERLDIGNRCCNYINNWMVGLTTWVRSQLAGGSCRSL